MNSKTLQNLKYFVNKVCSIVTTSMNRSFDEQISREHFVIRVQDVSVDGVWGYHPHNEELISFFQWNHIISIHQEVELNPSDPEHAEMIREYEERTGEKVKSDLGEQKNKKSLENKTDLLPVIHDNIATSEVEDLEPGEATFVDIRNLELLADKCKQSFDIKEKLNV